MKFPASSISCKELKVNTEVSGGNLPFIHYLKSILPKIFPTTSL